MNRQKIMQAISEELRSIRAVKRISIVDLGKKLNLSPKTVGGYLNGHVEIPLGYFYQICNILETDPISVLEAAQKRMK